MKRVLCLISGMNAGGAETFLMKLYRELDKSRFQMDFCINVTEKCFYEDEIISMGGKIYRIPTKSEDVKRFRRELSRIIRENGYKYVLRVTSSAMGFLDLHIAKKAGAQVCAARSSNASDGGSFKSLAVHRLGRFLYGKAVDVKIAPSDLAARYTFGDKAYESGQVIILHNAIDTGLFEYKPDGRNRVRAELGITDDTYLIGHIGRLSTQKNHVFLLDIFDKIKQREPQAVLLLVGKGELEAQIREKASFLGIADSVIFAGVRADIPDVLSAMDAFVFPSLYEGMPNTVIEAQATGLPCIIADTITREADITGIVEYLPLNADADEWAVKALAAAEAPRKDTKSDLIAAHYDIGSVVNDFTNAIFGE